MINSKITAENKVIKQIYIFMTKIQTCKQLCNTHAQTGYKNPKYNNTKNYITDLAIANQIKTVTAQGKNHNKN